MPATTTGILPVHNEAAVLETVLDSIEHQSRPVDELIVILDRCTDESETLARSRCTRAVRVDFGNTASSVMEGVRQATSPTLVLFDGNTAVPSSYVAEVLRVLAEAKADLVEWHGGMMAFPRSTIERFGPFAARYLWTLEYFLRVPARGGTVVRLDGPFTRLRPSPLRRNIRYGLEYVELADTYGLPPYFRVGRKSGWLPDSVALLGAVLGHVRRRDLLGSFIRTGRYLRSRRPDAS